MCWLAADRTAAAREAGAERHRDRAADRNRDRPSDRQERQIETERQADGTGQQRKPIITDDYFWWRTTRPNTSFARLSLKSALTVMSCQRDQSA